MVFSESQMYAQGLTEADLSIVELKCVEFNKELSEDWTLLLNYMTTTGMTKEVIIRQMALIALLDFDSMFSSSSFLSETYTLYPSSLNLRSISFDSVMCMLMLNVTKDSSYIYGDTMQNLISNTDIITGAMLLITAAVCTWIIPFVRQVTLGLMLLLGFVALVKSIMKDAKEKGKVTIGFFGCHIVYLIVVLLYYILFSMLMRMTSSSEVLTLDKAEMTTGSPMICILFVLLISLFYTAASVAMCWFCVKNAKDMGFAALKGTIDLIGSKISSGTEKMMAKAEALAAGDDKAASGKGGSGSGKGSGKSGKGSSDGSGKSDDKSKDKKSGDGDHTENYNYHNENNQNITNDTDSSTIDIKIESGKKKINGNKKGDTDKKKGSGIYTNLGDSSISINSSGNGENGGVSKQAKKANNTSTDQVISNSTRRSDAKDSGKTSDIDRKVDSGKNNI
jgi:hypothetical protein